MNFIRHSVVCAALCALSVVACGSDDDNPEPRNAGGGSGGGDSGGGNGGPDGGGSGGDSGRDQRLTVGGSVSGLQGSGLILQNNGGDDLAITEDGAFTFATSLAAGEAYAVTVATQPNAPNERCRVGNGSGTVETTDVTDVSIQCRTPEVPVSGLLFNGDDGSPDGGEALWITNGFSSDTIMLSSEVTRVQGRGQPSTAVVLSGEQYFFGRDSDGDVELWKTDGTPDGTVKVSTTNNAGALDTLRAADGFVFFLAEAEDGFEPWASDGTEAGTIRLREAEPGNGINPSDGVAAIGDHVLFAARDEDNGEEPWITDGTRQGTRILVDLSPGSISSSPRGFASITLVEDVDRLRTRVWFVANGVLFSTEDLTGAPDARVRRFESQRLVSSPQFRVWNNELYLLNSTNPKTLDVLRNGTLEGLGRLVGSQQCPLFRSDAFGNILLTERGLVFSIGPCIYLYDGEPDSSPEQIGVNRPRSDVLRRTYTIIELNGSILASPPPSGQPYQLLNDTFDAWIELPPGQVTTGVVGVRGDPRFTLDLFFTAFDRESGNELWKTDGTVDGTERVVDLNPGMADGIPRD